MFINIVPNWYRIGAKLAPHDPKIVKLLPNLPKRLPNCSRDGFEASYSEVYSNTLVRIYPPSGTIAGRFVEYSLTWYPIGTELVPNWHHMTPELSNWYQIGTTLAPNWHHMTTKLLNCHQIGQNGFQIVTATGLRPVIVRFMQTPS